jgi:hypothetical protein
MFLPTDQERDSSYRSVGSSGNERAEWLLLARLPPSARGPYDLCRISVPHSVTGTYRVGQSEMQASASPSSDCHSMRWKDQAMRPSVRVAS